MEQVSLWKTRESFGRMLGSGIAGWYVNSICHFLRNLHTSFHNNGQFTVPLGVNKGLPLPTSFIVVPFLGDSLSAWSLPLVSIVAISLCSLLRYDEALGFPPGTAHSMGCLTSFQTVGQLTKKLLKHKAFFLIRSLPQVIFLSHCWKTN